MVDRRIESSFCVMETKRPNLSTLLNFIATAQGRKFNRLTLYKYFKKLVNKEDYSKSDKEVIFEFVVEKNNQVDAK